MVYLNLQIQNIADGLIALGWNPNALPREALVAVDTVSPTDPNAGQLWLNSSNYVLSIYTGTSWQALGLTPAQVTTLATLSGNVYTKAEVDTKVSVVDAKVNTKQDTLISGTTIKTVNQQPIIGAGNITIAATMGAVNDLTDANIVSPSNGQILSYDSVSSQWINITPIAGITDHTSLTNVGTNTHADIDTALTRLANTSGTNTGDETVDTIKTKLGIITLSGSNTGDQDLSGYSLTSHNHSGVYEPADATILKSASIGVTVQGYDANTAFKNVSQEFTGSQRQATTTLSYGASIDLNFSTNGHQKVTLTGNTTFVNPTVTPIEGQSGTIKVVQDATGGRTVAWGTYFKWEGGTAPTYVTTANSVSTYAYKVESATQILLVPIIDWK